MKSLMIIAILLVSVFLLGAHSQTTTTTTPTTTTTATTRTPRTRTTTTITTTTPTTTTTTRTPRTRTPATTTTSTTTAATTTRRRDRDCPIGQVLINNNCVSAPPGSIACSASMRCSGNAVCTMVACTCPTGYASAGNNACSPVSSPSSCPANQVLVNGQCLNMVSVGMQCQVAQQCQGGSSCQAGICQCTPGTTFNGNTCGQQQPPSSSCAPYQVMANGQCYNMATVGMQCQVNQQCQGGSACQTGTCQCPYGYTFNGNSCVQQQQPPTMNQPTCSNPAMRAEMNGAVAKSCAQQYCSSGYQCEWNPNYVNNNIRGQYICCGGSTVFNPTPAPTAAPTGRIRMYDATSTPVQCFKTTDCSNVTGYTNCVRSATYNYNVCCSTSACP
uniref:EGF-like domain-containing protein n=1 Tax=Plectus sambesii TaxID=2011161 RepID=A0A914WNK6_9BILA